MASSCSVLVFLFLVFLSSNPSHARIGLQGQTKIEMLCSQTSDPKVCNDLIVDTSAPGIPFPVTFQVLASMALDAAFNTVKEALGYLSSLPQDLPQLAGQCAAAIDVNNKHVLPLHADARHAFADGRYGDMSAKMEGARTLVIKSDATFIGANSRLVDPLRFAYHKFEVLCEFITADSKQF